MKVLVLGASGATGKLVALQLLKRQINLRVVVRAAAILPAEIQNNPQADPFVSWRTGALWSSGG